MTIAYDQTFDMSKLSSPGKSASTKPPIRKRAGSTNALIKTAKQYNWIISKNKGTTTFEKRKQFPTKTLHTKITQVSAKEFIVERSVYRNGKKQPNPKISTVSSIRGVLKTEYAACIRPRFTHRESL